MRVTILSLLLAFCATMTPDSAPAAAPIASFALTWDSGATLTHVWCMGVGDAGQNRRFDFAGSNYNPMTIHLWEFGLTSGCVESWVSPPSGVGVYTAMTFGDTDRDGRVEILAGEGSSVGIVRIYEQSGTGFSFVSDAVREGDLYAIRSICKILTGDLDGDREPEIVVVSGGCCGSVNGVVGIWKHTGAAGSHTYLRVHGFETSSWLVDAALGDTDNDGFPEVVLGSTSSLDGLLTVQRILYDPWSRTWQDVEFATDAYGAPVAVCVADVDLDGRNETILGNSPAAPPRVFILENTGRNSYRIRFRGSETLNGDVFALAAGRFACPEVSVIAAGSYGGEVVVWQYNNKRGDFDLYARMSALGGPVRGLALTDDREDGYGELVVALGDPASQIRVYRRQAYGSGGATPTDHSGSAAQLVAQPNPFREITSLRVVDKSAVGDARVEVFDCRGRRVRALSLAGTGVEDVTTAWDGRDDQGRPAPAGAYYCRLVTRGSRGPATRVVRVR